MSRRIGLRSDCRNRLASAAGWNYGHNGQGQRVSKQGATTRYFAWDEQGRMIGEYDATAPVQETVYLGDALVAVLRAGSTYYVDTGHFIRLLALYLAFKAWLPIMYYYVYMRAQEVSHEPLHHHDHPPGT